MRLLRGTAITALIWGLVWAVGFSPLQYLNWRNLNVEGFPRSVSDLLVGVLLTGVWGAVSGGVFALLLGALERRSGWGGLRAPRIALWGFLAGIVPGLVFGMLSAGRLSLAVLAICGISGLLGSLLGLMHFWLAQHEPPSTTA